MGWMDAHCLLPHMRGPGSTINQPAEFVGWLMVTLDDSLWNIHLMRGVCSGFVEWRWWGARQPVSS